MKKRTKRIVLITGAAGGIGKATAEIFATDKKCSDVILVDHINKAKDLFEVGATLARVSSGRIIEIKESCHDLASSYAETERFIKNIVADKNRIDVLINVAGIAPKKMAPLVKTDDNEAERIMRVNYWGTRNMCKAVLPIMRANGYGRIINVASISALMPDAGNIDYSASKAAVVQLTRGLAIEAPKNVKDDLHPYDITVNAVAPGIVETAMAKQLSESMIEGFKTTAPLRRLMTPEDVARAIFWLTSKNADAINGVVLRIDGGFLA